MNNHELLKLVIISFILMTLMFYSVVTLGGELRCWSLSGLKQLITAHSYSWMKRSTVEITRRAQRHFTRGPAFNPE